MTEPPVLPGLIYVLNDGPALLSVATADLALFHVWTNGNYLTLTNPSIGPGQYMLLGYGGSNGTSIVNFADTYSSSSVPSANLTGTLPYATLPGSLGPFSTNNLAAGTNLNASALAGAVDYSASAPRSRDLRSPR